MNLNNINKSLAFLVFFSNFAFAQEKLIQLQVENREPDTIPILQSIKSDDARNLILIPGGRSGTGEIRNGLPSSRNFLVRSRDRFQKEGFNTFILFRAKSVAPEIMITTYRNEQAHLDEIQTLLNYIKNQTSGDIWIIGTSMGTISAVSAALKLKTSRIKGVILTASVTTYASGNLSTQNFDDIQLPVFMVHHEKDECFATTPDEARRVFNNIKAEIRKDFLFVNGGGPAKGDPCHNQHWHGFIGIEALVVNSIVNWIKDPNR